MVDRIAMRVRTELMFLPYAGKRQQTLADVLIRELARKRWKSFRAAIAFARQSGNHPKLVEALVRFTRRGGQIEMTFGANTFSGGDEGSDYDAVKTLLGELSKFPKARISLYNELARTFHPKFYLFASERAALLIIGSSNWSHGGLENNVEANVLLHLDFSDAEQKAAYDEATAVFETYWRAVE